MELNQVTSNGVNEDKVSHKKRFISLFLFGLILVAGYFALTKQTGNVANGFEGNLVTAEANIIAVRGIYTNDGLPADAEEGVKDVRVEITTDTVIQRETFDIPAGGGTFVVDDLPKVTSTITIEDMKRDAMTQTLGLIIETEGNISDKEMFVAKKIVYRLPKFIPTQ